MPYQNRNITLTEMTLLPVAVVLLILFLLAIKHPDAALDAVKIIIVKVGRVGAIIIMEFFRGLAVLNG